MTDQKRNPAHEEPGGVPATVGECAPGTHLVVLVYTRRVRDLFRLRYWLCCWECDMRIGPLR